jgi:Fur family ferric uptake transcriptional regulator
MERSTRQRDAIRNAFAEAGRPLTPQELFEVAQSHVPRLGMATVYRNIKALMDAGDLVAVPLPGQAARYELAGHGHHHHFHCTGCDRVFEVHACPGNLKNLAPNGFSIEAHELTLIGRCRDCGLKSARTVIPA